MLLNQIGNASSNITYALGIYPDDHFRLGYENFEDSFSAVYKNLILDRKIFEKYFTEDMRSEFYKELKKDNIHGAFTILSAACVDLISTEAISADFVNLRLREEFVRYYFIGVR
jgi:hypothetical protein